MTTIEEIKIAVNQQIENNEIDGFAQIRNGDLHIFVRGVFPQNVIEWVIDTYPEIINYAVDFNKNVIVYTYVVG